MLLQYDAVWYLYGNVTNTSCDGRERSKHPEFKAFSLQRIKSN